MARRRDLLASYFTLAGDVNPLCGSTVSPFAFRERVEVAAASGFKAFGLFDTDLLKNAEREGIETMRLILDDHGFGQPEVELQSWPWYAPDDGAALPIADFFACVEQLGCSHIKVGGAIGAPRSIAGFTEAYAALCDRAKEAGTRIALEMVPFTNVADLATACEIVEAADRPNGGHVVDSWHVFRGGESLDTVADLPGHRLFAVELNDAARTPEGSLIDDTLRRRRFCGEGSFDLAAFVRAIERTGNRGKFGVEILSDALRAMPLSVVARRAFDTTSRLLDQID